MKERLAFWLCLGGAIIFVSFLCYCLVMQPLWAALMGSGMLGTGCLTHAFHDLRKPEMEDYDPLTFT